MSNLPIQRLILLNQMAGPLFRQLAQDLSVRFPAGCVLLTGHPDTLHQAGNVGPKLTIRAAPPYDRRSKLRRVLSWLRYVLATTGPLLQARPGDAILIVSNPPLLGPWVWLLTRGRRLPYAVLVYDIHPDVLVRLGVLAREGVVASLWRWANRRVYRGASAVITIGARMAGVLARQVGVPGHDVGVVSPWVDVDVIKPLTRADNEHAPTFVPAEGMVVLYSGNMGASHDIDSILAAALALRERGDICFVFIGEGEKYADVLAFVAHHQLPNVRVFPFQPEDMLPYTLPLGDIALVALDEGMEDLMVPSKTYGYLAAGSAVIAIARRDSELADIVEGNACGQCVPPRQPAALAAAIASVADEPTRLLQWRANARIAAECHYSRQAGVDAFVHLLGQANLMPLVAPVTVAGVRHA